MTIARLRAGLGISHLLLPAVLAAACGGKSPMQPGPTTNPPQIACAADVVLSGVVGGSKPVTFSAPTITGGAAPVAVSCNPASGADFALGTTPVNCLANDTQNRQAACSFKVTLNAPTFSIKKFLAVGDSLTEGQNGHVAFRIVDVPNAYPTKLQQAFDFNYPGQGISVNNQGVGGERIETTVARLRNFLTKDRPDAVLVLGGYNNLTGPCAFGGSASQACSDATADVSIGLRDCIRKSKEAPSNVPYVFVATLTPPGPSGPRRIRADAIIQTNTRIRQMVSTERAVLVDLYPLFIGHEAEYVDDDGLHLRPAGYQAIADAFFAAITATVPQTSLTSRVW